MGMALLLCITFSSAAFIAVPFLLVAARKERRRRDSTLATLGLVISGEQVAEAIKRGWTVWRVAWGAGEYWIVDGVPILDSRRQLFTNGMKLQMGEDEWALTAYARKIAPYRYRT